MIRSIEQTAGANQIEKYISHTPAVTNPVVVHISSHFLLTAPASVWSRPRHQSTVPLRLADFLVRCQRASSTLLFIEIIPREKTKIPQSIDKQFVSLACRAPAHPRVASSTPHYLRHVQLL
jgi:hypothetical protein